MSALLVFLFIAVIGLVPSISASWNDSATPNFNNPGVDWAVSPNTVDNASTVHYLGVDYTVAAVDTVGDWQTFYIYLQGDNQTNNVDVVIQGIIEGPGSGISATSWNNWRSIWGFNSALVYGASDWETNGWVGFSIWDWPTSSWSSSTAQGSVVTGQSGVNLTGIDNNENVIIRVATHIPTDVAYWYPGRNDIRIKVFNHDTPTTVYGTPDLVWWSWGYTLGTSTNTAVADTYTVSTASTTNYGTDSTMETSNVGGNTKYAYAMFSLTVPANYGIQSAYLRYCIDSGSSGSGGSIYETDTEWVENTLTWGVQDTVAYTVGSTLGAVLRSPGWENLDVTSTVLADITAAHSAVSFRFYDGAASPADIIRTKEYGDGSYAPQLIITYAPLVSGVKPTFSMLTPQLGDKSGDYYNLILQGNVSAMNDETGINFTFIAQNSPSGGSWHSFPSAPIYVSSASTFSTTTTGYLFEDSTLHKSSPTYYWFELKGAGLNLHQNWYYPENTWLQFWIHDNAVDITIPGGGGALQATISATNVTPTDTTAIAYYTFTVIGGSGTAGISVDLRTSGDNLADSNYTEYSTGATLSSTYSGQYQFQNLTPSTDYWVRFVGYDTKDNLTWKSSWYKFTTTTAGGGTVDKGIQGWPDILADKFGGSRTAAGIFLAVLFALPFMLMILVFAGGSGNVFPILMVFTIMLLAVETFAFMWIDAWILVSMVVVMIFAGAMKIGLGG